MGPRGPRMSERFTVLREARRHHRRLWYFWPAYTLSALFAASGVYAVAYEQAHVPGVALVVVAALQLWCVRWLERTR